LSSGGAWFELWMRHRLYWPRIFVILLTFCITNGRMGRHSTATDF
jgi:hypothetical protein